MGEKANLTNIIILLQSTLQPLWVLACSTIVEHSKQEVFYRVPLPVACQTPNLEDQWLERSNSLYQVSPMPETMQVNPSSGRWNYGREMAGNFCRKWRLPRHFRVLLHAVNLWHGTDGFTSPPKEGVLRIFLPKKSDGFSRVWTRELGYQRLARLPLDHRSRNKYNNDKHNINKI